jgi:hypothetical protein
LTFSETLEIGGNLGSPASPECKSLYRFTGRIGAVKFKSRSAPASSLRPAWNQAGRAQFRNSLTYKTMEKHCRSFSIVFHGDLLDSIFSSSYIGFSAGAV